MNARTNPVLVALDTTSVEKASQLSRTLSGLVGGVKLGLEFFGANGPEGVKRVADGGAPLFLDLKFHDIPNTVAGAVRAVTPLAPAILNVHASGGLAMMEAASQAAAETAAKHGVNKPLVIAVTVLTSMDQAALNATGAPGAVLDQVLRLADLAQKAGLDGVVCSAHEAAAIRSACGKDFKLIVPGIRPAWSEAGDQKRIKTPSEALNDGADYLVIGRPITGASDPAEAARKIADEIA